MEEDASAASYIFALWNLIIRPPRNRYSDRRLNAACPKAKFKVAGQAVHRNHFRVVNPRGHGLLGTLFEPQLDSKGPEAERAVVVYCHGNSSNRLAGFELVRLLCPMNIAVACFDFAGCGNSEGEYISLGFHERDDLAAVLEHLRSCAGFTRLGVWGYSMGAATALMHASRDMSIAGIVMDSPFADLCDVIKEVAYNCLRLPTMLINAVLPILRLIIRNKADFDIYEVSPSKHASSCFVPCFIMHGEEDEFIKPSQSEQLKNKYVGECMRILMPAADHTSPRSLVFWQRAAVFMVRALRWEPFLPPSYTEERLAKLGDTREETHAVKSAASHIGKPMIDQEVICLLMSSERAEHCLGVIMGACDVCAYRGAELLPCKLPTGGSTPSAGIYNAHCRSSVPAGFQGSVNFATDRAEIALCWVQLGVKARRNTADYRVYFAMLSANAISLTRVTLLYDLGVTIDAIKAMPREQMMERLRALREAKEMGRSCGGLRCVSVEPLLLSAAQLLPGHSHDVKLTISGSRIILTAAGARLEYADADHEEQVELWCMQWRSPSNTGKDSDTCLQLAPLPDPLREAAKDQESRSLAPGALSAQKNLSAEPPEGAFAVINASLSSDGSRNGSLSSTLPFEERLAQSLAKMCLGSDLDNAEMDGGGCPVTARQPGCEPAVCRTYI